MRFVAGYVVYGFAFLLDSFHVLDYTACIELFLVSLEVENRWRNCKESEKPNFEDYLSPLVGLHYKRLHCLCMRTP